MRKNMLKEKIRNGESAIGTFVKLTDPAVPELLALAGFDFFVLDTEHVAVDREQLTNIVRAADAAGITPIVRVRENQQVEILQNLDLGYAGVQVPNVDTPEQARNLVSYVKYTPLGVRGLSPSVRACDYGTCGVQEYIDTANANTMIVSHCESKTCVENLDEVLKVDGIDVIFLGPKDLSHSPRDSISLLEPPSCTRQDHGPRGEGSHRHHHRQDAGSPARQWAPRRLPPRRPRR